MSGEALAFALEIDREWAAMQEDLHTAVTYLALEAVRRVDAKSPVDTGRFRANWTLSIGGPDASVTEAVDPGGARTVAENMGRAQAYPEEGYPVIYLQNNLPYAERLEGGYSKQAPAGMVAITTAELAGIWEGYEL